jgi:uncharacterized protein YcbK (DUF882 family)
MERNILYREVGIENENMPPAVLQQTNTHSLWPPFLQNKQAAFGNIPEKADEEKKAGGYTCYVAVDLKMQQSDRFIKYKCGDYDKVAKKCLQVNKNQPEYAIKSDNEKLTAIFKPDHFDAAATTDLIIYLHGHKAAHPGSNASIKAYLNYCKQPFFQLRETISSSSKNVILIAPALGPRSQYGSLAIEFDAYMENIIAAINEYIIRQKNANGKVNIGKIIIAAHSGGGAPMLAIANSSSKYANKINEFWGFDSLYQGSGESDNSWIAIAKKNTAAKFFFYSNGTKNTAAGIRQRADKMRLCNICITGTAIDHYSLVRHFLKERLAGKLCNYNNCQAKKAILLKEKEINFLDEENFLAEEFELPFDRAIDNENDIAETFVEFPSGLKLPITKGLDTKGQYHYDINNSGNPVLDAGKTYRSKLISKNFTVGDFAQSGGTPFSNVRIDLKLLDCLQKMTDFLQKKITITSGYRPYGYNKKLRDGKIASIAKKESKTIEEVNDEIKKGRKVYPAAFSQHMSGKGVDIKIPGMTGIEIAKTAIDVYGCGVAVGLATGFAHIDVRGTFAVWPYEKGITKKQIDELKKYHTERCVKKIKSKPVPVISIDKGVQKIIKDDTQTAGKSVIKDSPVLQTKSKTASSSAANNSCNLKKLVKKGKGYKAYGGGNLKLKLNTLRSLGKLNITDKDIELLHELSRTESDGAVQAINSWDSAYMSMGFAQFTFIHKHHFQYKKIVQIASADDLKRIEKTSPEAFSLYFNNTAEPGKLQMLIQLAPVAFKKYGIELSGNTIKFKDSKNKTHEVQSLTGLNKLSELRNYDWGRKFFCAGIDDEIIIAEAKLTLYVLDMSLYNMQIKLGNSYFVSYYKSSALLRGLIQEAYNNRPVYLTAALKITSQLLEPKEKVTVQDFITLLKQQIVIQYDENENNKAKGLRLTDKY